MNTDRAEIAKKNFLRSVMQKMKFQESVINKTDLWRFTDSAVRNGKTNGLSVNNNTVLFSIGKEQTLVENWVMYNRAAGIVNTSAYAARYDAYMLQSANSYYREHLAEFEPAFKEQLQEFKDANLLFAAMEKEVWSKAANDSVALQKHYQQHRQQYTWANGANALMITATDSLAAERYKKQLLQQPNEWKAIAANMQEQIIADSARFELTQLPALNGASYSNGFCTPLQHNDMDNSYSFVYVFQLMPGGDIRQFEDAKGWVINDYQQVLEKQWIDSLRKKYPVKVNDAVWQTLLRNNK
jgi:peptidyl-prolyl cis-trans isomerase SurA